ncbi:MAG: hypothetical protein KatS3mg024_0684 [Armatimonadota bacterium]|nr:MAG: hypothetical protein KatS3mg024_0684 [Armatimonadota bacterium]
MDTDYQEQNSPTVQELLAQVRELEQKVARLQRERSVYAAKARLLSEELEKYRSRELRQDNTVETLLERQREMHVMLNRSHIMLAKAQNATAMLSLEFGELARALPETVSAQAEADPEQAQTVQYEIDDRIRRINDLFRMTGELSQEIAETLEGTEKAMQGGGATTVQSPPQEPSIQKEKPAAAASPAPCPSAPQETAAPQQVPPAPTQEEESEATVAEVVEEQPATEEATGDAAGPQRTDVREAVFSEVTEQESPSAPETASALGGHHEQSFSSPHRTAVPPPKDIFVSPAPTPRRKLFTGAVSGGTPSRTKVDQPLSTDDRDGSEAAQAREALDRLVREQEERDAHATGGASRKRGFWSRLFGG